MLPGGEVEGLRALEHRAHDERPRPSVADAEGEPRAPDRRLGLNGEPHLDPLARSENVPLVTVERVGREPGQDEPAAPEQGARRPGGRVVLRIDPVDVVTDDLVDGPE